MADNFIGVDEPATIDKKLRSNTRTVGTDSVHEEGILLVSTTSGTYIDPATDRTLATAPFSTRLTDGTAFYSTVTGAQLPAALVSGRLDVNLGATAITQPVSGSVTVSGTVTAIQGTAATITAPWFVLPGTTALASNPFSTRLTDGSAFYNTVTGTQLPAALVSGRLDVNIGATAVTQPISGTVTANAGSGTFVVDSELPAATALADAMTNFTVPVVGSALMGFNGTTWDRLRTESATAFNLRVGLWDGTNKARIVGAAGDTDSDGQIRLDTWAKTYGFNGTSWDRLRSDTTNGLDVDVTRVQGTVTVSGTVTANAGTGNFSVIGTKTSNGGVPGATNLGVLAGVATAGAPTYTEGNQVSLSTDLAGALRVSGSAGGGVAQLQVRNEADSAWVNVGVGAESTAVHHVPVMIQDAGTTPAVVATANPASGDAALVSRIVGQAADNSTNATTKVPTLGARANAGAPTWSEGNQVPLSVDTSGQLRITGSLSGGGNQTSTNVTGTIAYATVDSLLQYTGANSFTGIAVQIVSTGITGGPVVSFQGSADVGSNWSPIQARRLSTGAWSSTYSAANETVVFQLAEIAGFSRVRTIVTTTGTAGTATVTINLSNEIPDYPWSGTGGVAAPRILSVGGLDAGSLLRSGTVLSATPGGTEFAFVTRNIVSGTQNVSLTATSVTQPISGTVTANQGSAATKTAPWFVMAGTGALASDPFPSRLTDGTSFIPFQADNTANPTLKLAVQGAVTSTAAPAYTNTNVVPLSVNTSGSLRALITDALPTGSNVIGTVAGTGTFTVSGTALTVTQGAAATSTAPWFVIPGTTATASNPFSSRLTDGTAFYDATKTGQLPSALVGGRLDVNLGATVITQPVSGTVTANQGTAATVTAPWPMIAGGTAINTIPLSSRLTDGTDWLASATGVPSTAARGLVVRPYLSDSTTTGTLNAAGSITHTVENDIAVGLNLTIAGTSMTTVFEGSPDGTNFDGMWFQNMLTGAWQSTTTSIATTNFQLPYLGGLSQVRVRVTAATTATATISFRGTIAPPVDHTFKGRVSTDNSTTATLAASGTFVGAGEDVKDYATISIFVFSSHTSAVDGLGIEYSTDNTNWDDSDDYTIPASTGKYFTVAPEAKYFRISYTNGTTAQTAFRLQTIFHYVRIKPSSHRVRDVGLTSVENDAELVLAVPSPIPEVKFVRINATADGDNTIISGVTGKKIRVLSYALTVTTSGTIALQDTAGTPVIHAQFALAASGGVSYAGSQFAPAFETAVGTGVEINTPAGLDCLGHMTYQEVD